MSIKKSFSLIEVLVFVTILSLFLITAAAIVTVTIRQNTLKINTLKATHYNEQLHEWLSNEKETDWNLFVSRADKTYCFSSTAMSWPVATLNKDLCTEDLDGMYRRYAILKTDQTPATQVETTVYAEWQEAGNWYSTQLHTIFTLWGQ